MQASLNEMKYYGDYEQQNKVVIRVYVGFIERRGIPMWFQTQYNVLCVSQILKEYMLNMMAFW